MRLQFGENLRLNFVPAPGQPTGHFPASCQGTYPTEFLQKDVVELLKNAGVTASEGLVPGYFDTIAINGRKSNTVDEIERQKADSKQKAVDACTEEAVIEHNQQYFQLQHQRVKIEFSDPIEFQLASKKAFNKVFKCEEDDEETLLGQLKQELEDSAFAARTQEQLRPILNKLEALQKRVEAEGNRIFLSTDVIATLNELGVPALSQDDMIRIRHYGDLVGRGTRRDWLDQFEKEPITVTYHTGTHTHPDGTPRLEIANPDAIIEHVRQYC